MPEIVIGKTLSDAQAFAERFEVPDAQMVSPRSIPRLSGLRVDRFHITPAAFEHPLIRPLVLTVQRQMQRRS